MSLTLTDRLLLSTVKMNRMRKGQSLGSGTGFFWRTDLGDQKEMVSLVTNKHVVEGCDVLMARCHEANADRTDSSGAFSDWGVAIEGGPAWSHPDPDVDLCAVAFGGVANLAEKRGTPLFYIAISADNLPRADDWERFDSIEEVVMIGCPRGIYDEFNNLPIARRGITATPLSKRYNGRDEFMVDMACFPGSSGSPVFLLNHGGHFDREKNSFMIGEGRFFFVGILYAGPLITNSGQIVLSQQPRVEVAAMMHLGQVLRSTALQDLDAHVLRVLAEEDAA